MLFAKLFSMAKQAALRTFISIVFILSAPAASFAISCSQVLQPVKERELQTVPSLKEFEGLHVLHADLVSLEVLFEVRKQSFYTPNRLIEFMNAFPEIARKLGFEIITQNDLQVQYKMPTPNSLNEKIQLLREAGELPQNGLRFQFAHGRLSESQYAEKFFGEDTVVIGTDETYFHDMHMHVMGSAFLPESHAALAKSEYQFLMNVVKPELAKQGKALTENRELAAAIDTAIAMAPLDSDVFDGNKVGLYSVLARKRVQSLQYFLRFNARYLKNSTIRQIKEFQKNYRELK